MKSFVQSVQKIAPDRVDEVATTLGETVGEVSPKEFFDANPTLLPAAAVEKVIADLGDRTRPIRRLDPANYGLRQIVSAGGIQIAGSVNDMKQMTSRQEGAVWVITIRVPEKPRTRFA